MGKLPANAGSERTAVSGVSNVVAQQPGSQMTRDEFVRTCNPSEMSRKQRRLCLAKIGKPGEAARRRGGSPGERSDHV